MFPAGQVTVSAGSGPTFTTGPAPGYQAGFVQVSARLSGCAGSATLTQRVDLGQGTLVINDGQQGSSCAESEATFAITQGYDPLSTYTWTVSQGRISAGQGTDQITVSDLPFGQYQLQVYLRGTATCPGAPDAEQAYAHNYYTRSPDGSFCVDNPSLRAAEPTATLYPNPSSDQVEVHLTGPTTPADALTVRLFDGYGRLRGELRGTGQAVLRLPTHHLPAGLYLVHLQRGARVLSRQQLKIVH